MALLWMIETVNYLLLLLWSESTVFSIARNMCWKDFDEQYTLDIYIYFFGTALLFILMSLLQMLYICFTLCGV